MNKQDIKKEIRRALMKRYGFGPTLADISLLEANDPRNGQALRALFEIGDGHQYSLDDGGIGEVRGSRR